MVFFKDAETKDAEFKYGFSHQGVFAKEFIKRGEAVFTCDLTICDYLILENFQHGRTKDEVEEIFKDLPQCKDFIHKYMYMIDDDLYDWPKNYMEQVIHEDCMFFNHSCEPNCGFSAIDASLVVAIRDIEPGEELTYDYQTMDTEASYYAGLDCKCGSRKCRGKLKFDVYRNVDWQNKFYVYSSGYVKRKINELKTKWYSSSCWVKRYHKQNGDKNDIELGLAAFEQISKHELVAKFADEEKLILKDHYIRHSENPSCVLIGLDVFAATELSPMTEITINYNLKN